MRKRQCGLVSSVLIICVVTHYVIYNFLYDPNRYVTSKDIAFEGVSRFVYRVEEREEAHMNGEPAYRIVYYNMPSWMSMDFTVLNSSTCPKVKTQCFVYPYNKYFDTADAVIFYGENLRNVPKKKKGQMWTFFSIESPFLYSVGKQWKDKFSWTMTYRHDSDFKYLYGIVYKRETPIKRNYSEIFRKKTKNVAWAVSNCITSSKREVYIKKLQQYINVDIYGKCGKLKCGKTSAGITKCHRKFAEEYKFYLAVENSVCKDYTTEKLFNFFFHNLTMIPIVNGPQNIHEYIPNGTYINMMDYSSPYELAKDLQRIGSDEALYASYLKEKDRYDAGRSTLQSMLCPMCERLHEQKKDSFIPDIHSWIWKDTCIKPK
jgi:hypothetical protein